MNKPLKILLKTLATLAIIVAVGFVGLIALIVASLSGASQVRQSLVALTAVFAALAALLPLWRPFSRKIRLIVLAVMLALTCAGWGGHLIYDAYHASFERMAEYDDRLWVYDPFRADTLAASLDEPSTLTFSDNLPRLDGATALYPVYSAFVRATYPEEQVEYVHLGDPILDENKRFAIDSLIACTRTDGAYERLIAGDVDIIFVAGPSEQQLESARAAGVELKLTPIGRDAFVFFVSAKNEVNALSIAQIRQIYSGQVTNWSELGGANMRIRAYQRPENSGSQTALVGFMGDTPLMQPPTEDVAAAMGGIITQVAAYTNYSGAIGYSFLHYATEMVRNDAIKLIELNGVAPTRENITNGTYPYAGEFYAVTAGTQNPHVQEFLDWMLSPQGQYLVEKTGYTPLAGE